MRQLNTTTNRILAVILCFGILSGFRSSTISKPATVSFQTTDTIIDAKSAAFEILKSKCNGCHRWQNPGKVFTASNMASLAPNIYEQVFIKKRMPRGNKIRLTEDEYNTLRNWLTTQNLHK